MGRRIAVLIIALLLVLCSSAWAHSGRTDSQGGHYNHSTGEYHFHHGYPEHQHPDGVCPYAASAKATAKPSTGSYRSSTVKTSSSVAVAVQSSKKEMNPSMIDALIVSTFLVIIAVLACVVFSLLIKLRQVKKDFETASSNCASARLECNRLKSELVDTNSALKFKTTEYDSLRQKCISLQNELGAKCAEHKKVCDALIAVNFERGQLLERLSEKENECADLSSAFGEHLADHDSHLSTVFEAKVYASKFNVGKYHCIIHGNWKDYKLISLRSAIEKGYSPCTQCFGALDKEYSYTGNHPKFSLNTAHPTNETTASDTNPK